MNHPEELLAAFVDGTATLQERATVEAHVTFCSDCRHEIELARSARAALQGLPDLEPPTIDLGSLAAGRSATSAAATAALPIGVTAEPPGQPAEPVGVGPGGREPARGPARAGHRRTPARWQVRVAQGALAAAAIAVAVGVFANLGGNSKLTSSAPSPAAGGVRGAIQAPAAAPTHPTQAYTAKSFAALAADLVRDVRGTRPKDRTFGAALSAAPSPTPGLPFVEQALSCLQQGTGLVDGNYLYYVQGATYEGTPVYLGAFLSGPGTSGESLVVTAVSVDGCRALQIIHEAV
ncbi:MAG TPA: zf-HC2 domain-containing protein [Actinomycetota bacterium]